MRTVLAPEPFPFLRNAALCHRNLRSRAITFPRAEPIDARRYFRIHNIRRATKDGENLR